MSKPFNKTVFAVESKGYFRCNICYTRLSVERYTCDSFECNLVHKGRFLKDINFQQLFKRAWNATV